MRSVQSFMATAGQAARVKELEAACIQAIRILRLYVNEYDSPTIIMLKKAVGPSKLKALK